MEITEKTSREHLLRVIHQASDLMESFAELEIIPFLVPHDILYSVVSGWLMEGNTPKPAPKMGIPVNGVEMNEKYPDTFHIPEIKQRQNVATGHYVKISMKPEGKENGEKFWTRVKSRVVSDNGKIWYIATVENDLTWFDLDCGDEITYSEDNVLMIAM